MQEKKKIFQPKVIIGSITSFIVAAVGIVAVFFPDLLNLEKSRINEYKSEIQSSEDATKLWEFLGKNKGKIVKLDLSYAGFAEGIATQVIYCATNQIYSYNGKKLSEYEFDVNIIQSQDPVCREYGEEKALGVIQHTGKTDLTKDQSGFYDLSPENMQKQLDVTVAGGGNQIWLDSMPQDAYEIENNAGLSFEYLDKYKNDEGKDEYALAFNIISIPYASNKGKKYILKNDGNKGILQGTFFVGDEIQGIETGEDQNLLFSLAHATEDEATIQSAQKLVLEPLDKKDLEFRKY